MTAYPKIPNHEIAATADHDPQKALMMLLANSTLEEADQKASGQAKHVPKEKKSGWSISIETPQGIVGLWSCWLEDRFYLGYPRDTPVLMQAEIDLKILRHLEVVPSTEVLQVDATAVDPGYQGEFKDPDKPLEKNSCGQIVAYKTTRMRRWAQFHSSRVDWNQGRVWVDHKDHNSTGHDFHFLLPGGYLGETYYGHDRSMSISTFPFSFWNKYAPDGPTADPAVIQTYRTKFLELACAVAKLLGGAKSVIVDYGFVLVPEQLENLGFTEVTWLRGQPGRREGFGEELVRAKKGEETLFLQSGNSIVPWSTFRHIPVAEELTAKDLLGFLTF